LAERSDAEIGLTHRQIAIGEASLHLPLSAYTEFDDDQSPASGIDRSARFGEDEKVVQSHPLLPGARPPRIGRTDLWDLNDVVERPVNQNAANRVIFAGLTPAWNLRAREMAMVWLNSRPSRRPGGRRPPYTRSA
jgi:hypothetical protein